MYFAFLTKETALFFSANHGRQVATNVKDLGPHRCSKMSNPTFKRAMKQNRKTKTSESHLIFHLGMELEPTPPNGYRKAGRYLMAITWAAHRVLCS